MGRQDHHAHVRLHFEQSRFDGVQIHDGTGLESVASAEGVMPFEHGRTVSPLNGQENLILQIHQCFYAAQG